MSGLFDNTKKLVQSAYDRYKRVGDAVHDASHVGAQVILKDQTEDPIKIRTEVGVGVLLDVKELPNVRFQTRTTAESKKSWVDFRIFRNAGEEERNKFRLRARQEFGSLGELDGSGRNPFVLEASLTNSNNRNDTNGVISNREGLKGTIELHATALSKDLPKVFFLRPKATIGGVLGFGAPGREDADAEAYAGVRGAIEVAKGVDAGCTVATNGVRCGIRKSFGSFFKR